MAEATWARGDRVAVPLWALGTGWVEREPMGMRGGAFLGLDESGLLALVRFDGEEEPRAVAARHLEAAGG